MDVPTTSDPILTIGVAAKRLGVSESTLRLYEREGLLISSRTRTGRRMYSLTDLRVVDCIRTLIQKHGLNFAGVRAFFSQIPCWHITSCTEEQRSRCSRFDHALIPCWLIPGWRLGQTGCDAEPETCRSCPVYTVGAVTIGLTLDPRTVRELPPPEMPKFSWDQA